MNSVASSGLDSTLRIMWANTGYNGRPLARYARAVAAITVEVAARTSPHSEAVIYRATAIIMTRCLACCDNGQLRIRRRGGERPGPPGKLPYLPAPGS